MPGRARGAACPVGRRLGPCGRGAGPVLSHGRWAGSVARPARPTSPPARRSRSRDRGRGHATWRRETRWVAPVPLRDDESTHVGSLGDVGQVVAGMRRRVDPRRARAGGGSTGCRRASSSRPRPGWLGVGGLAGGRAGGVRAVTLVRVARARALPPRFPRLWAITAWRRRSSTGPEPPSAEAGRSGRGTAGGGAGPCPAGAGWP